MVHKGAEARSPSTVCTKRNNMRVYYKVCHASDCTDGTPLGWSERGWGVQQNLKVCESGFVWLQWSENGTVSNASTDETRKHGHRAHVHICMCVCMRAREVIQPSLYRWPRYITHHKRPNRTRIVHVNFTTYRIMQLIAVLQSLLLPPSAHSLRLTKHSWTG